MSGAQSANNSIPAYFLSRPKAPARHLFDRRDGSAGVRNPSFPCSHSMFPTFSAIRSKSRCSSRRIPSASSSASDSRGDERSVWPQAGAGTSQVGSAIGYILLAVAAFNWHSMTTRLILVYASRIIDGFTGGNISTAQAYVSDVTTRRTGPGAWECWGRHSESASQLGRHWADSRGISA